MKHIAQTLSTPMSSASADAALPVAWIQEIAKRLTAQFGARFADMYECADGNAFREEWGKGLAGFQAQELERGLKACASRPFPPTLGDFARACRPSLDPEYAFHEAAHALRQRDEGHVGDWTHPGVYRAAIKMSPEVRGGNYKEVRRRWEELLRRELLAGWGDPVPAPAPRLSNHMRCTPMPPEFREWLRRFRGDSSDAQHPRKVE